MVFPAPPYSLVCKNSQIKHGRAINLNLLKSYIDALYSFGDSAVIRLKKRQNWEEVAKLR